MSFIVSINGYLILLANIKILKKMRFSLTVQRSWQFVLGKGLSFKIDDRFFSGSEQEKGKTVPQRHPTAHNFRI